jgi:hypothetical protein
MGSLDTNLLIEVLGSNWVALIALVVSVATALGAARQKQWELWFAWRRDVVDWAREGMTALATAQNEVRRIHTLAEPEALALKTRLQSQLSAAVDHGRLFFLNKKKLRPEVLDPLVCVYALLNEDLAGYGPQRLYEIVEVHRTNFWRRAQRAMGTRLVQKAVKGIDAPAGIGTQDFNNPTLDPPNA